MVTLDSTVAAVRSTLAGVLGMSGGPFAGSGPARAAQLTIDADAQLPSGAKLLRGGQHHNALVQVTPASDEATVRTLCIKVPDAYGSGRDQDLLLASSADGVPFHHLTIPATRVDSRLYSSLWIYLAGVRPVLFGARNTGVDDEYEFLLSDVIGRFRRIGVLHLGTPRDDADIRFAARNSGGGLRPLPPVSLYNAG
jgi:hypothetical protein